MRFSSNEIEVKKVRLRELTELEKIFAAEFSEEINLDVVRARIRRIRQFYYLLLPLETVSPWVRGLFYIYVIRVKKEFAGFLQLSLIGKKKLHLDFIAIGKQFRGKGLGEYVLQRMMRDFADRGGLGVALEVRLDNPAYRLYQRLGFKAKLQILHYERRFSGAEFSEFLNEKEFELKMARPEERNALYDLYLQCMPLCLLGIAEKSRQQYQTSLFVRQLTWLKNRLLKNQERLYIVKNGNKIISGIEIKSYRNAKYHVMNLLLHPAFEILRTRILKRIVAILSEAYGEGQIATNIYDDQIAKQNSLDDIGFVKTEAYFYMYRSPLQLPEFTKSTRCYMTHKPNCMNRIKITKKKNKTEKH